MKQSLAEIKTMSVEMLARERDVADAVQETTPVSLTPRLEEFCQSLGGGVPAFIPTVDDPHGLFGWCCDGVREKIKAEGGGIAFGWTIWEWPNVLWTAEFHAVWRSTTGELIDITPKPKRESQILFVIDPSYPETFDFDDRPGNRRQCAYQPVDPTQLAAERLTILKPSQLAYEQKRADKAGVSLLQWLEAKVPQDTLASTIDGLISACNDHERYLDTLGTSGEIRVDPKLLMLLRRRIAAQTTLTRALDKTKKSGLYE